MTETLWFSISVPAALVAFYLLMRHLPFGRPIDTSSPPLRYPPVVVHQPSLPEFDSSLASYDVGSARYSPLLNPERW